MTEAGQEWICIEAIMTKSLSLSAALLIMSATVADATVYTGVRDVGGNAVRLSITTDSAFGKLAASDITDFRVELTGPIGHYILGPANAFINADQARLFATSQALSYDFTNPAGVNYIGFEGKQDPLPEYCLSSSFYCLGSPGEVVSTFPLAAMFPTKYSTNHDQLITVATAASDVPEPSVFAAMTFALILTSLAIRRNKPDALPLHEGSSPRRRGISELQV